jgi:hypothetical protein
MAVVATYDSELPRRLFGPCRSFESLICWSEERVNGWTGPGSLKLTWAVWKAAIMADL